MVSSSLPENNSEMLSIHSSMSEIGMSATQSCRIQYSSQLGRYLWVRSVRSKDSSNNRSTYITHILHTSEPNESFEAVTRLSLLPKLSNIPPDKENPEVLMLYEVLQPIKANFFPDTFKSILYTMLFDFPRGRGICIVCSKNLYDSDFAKLAQYILTFMPENLAHSVSVTMNPTRMSRSSLINIVAEGAEIDNSLILRYDGVSITAENPSAGNAIRNAICEYLIKLFSSSRNEYYEEFKYLHSWLKQIEPDKLPPDNFLYTRWAEMPNKILLDQSVTDAMTVFLCTSVNGEWNTLKPRFFVRTLRYLCTRYLEGYANTKDAEPSLPTANYSSLIKLLLNCSFPSCTPQTIFLSTLILHYRQNVSNQSAMGIFFALHEHSPEKGNDVSNALLKEGTDILREFVECLSLEIISNADTKSFIWNDRFREKTTEVLLQGLKHPYLTGSLDQTEGLLHSAFKNILLVHSDWHDDILKFLQRPKEIFMVISEAPVKDSDIDIFELYRFRCRNLDRVFGIDKTLIANNLIMLYNQSPEKSLFSGTVSGICKELGINPYFYERYLEVTKDQLTEYVNDHIMDCFNLSDKICRIHELISVRQNFKGSRNDLSEVYFRCIDKALNVPDCMVCRNYGSLSDLINGLYGYHPIYTDYRNPPFHKADIALTELFHALSKHLKDIDNLCNSDKDYFTENALSTTLMIEIEKSISIVKSNSPQQWFWANIDDNYYASCFFHLMWDKRFSKPEYSKLMVSKEILTAMNEVINNVRIISKVADQPTDFTMKKNAALHILFGESQNHINTFLFSQGAETSLYSIVLSALLSDCSDYDGRWQRVSEAYSQFRRIFRKQNFHFLLGEFVPRVVIELYNIGFLTAPLKKISSGELSSDLKKSINGGIERVEKVLNQGNFSPDVAASEPLSNKDQESLKRIRSKIQEREKKIRDLKNEIDKLKKEMEDISGGNHSAVPFPLTDQETTSVLALLKGLLPVLAISVILAMTLFLSEKRIILLALSGILAVAFPVALILGQKASKEAIRTICKYIVNTAFILSLILIFTYLLLYSGMVI